MAVVKVSITHRRNKDALLLPLLCSDTLCGACGYCLLLLVLLPSRWNCKTKTGFLGHSRIASAVVESRAVSLTSPSSTHHLPVSNCLGTSFWSQVNVAFVSFLNVVIAEGWWWWWQQCFMILERLCHEGQRGSRAPHHLSYHKEWQWQTYPGPPCKACEQPGERHVRDAKCTVMLQSPFRWVKLLFSFSSLTGLGSWVAL